MIIIIGVLVHLKPNETSARASTHTRERSRPHNSKLKRGAEKELLIQILSEEVNFIKNHRYHWYLGLSIPLVIIQGLWFYQRLVS